MTTYDETRKLDLSESAYARRRAGDGPRRHTKRHGRAFIAELVMNKVWPQIICRVWVPGMDYDWSVINEDKADRERVGVSAIHTKG